jgi:serine/threonine protein kinase
MAIRVAIEGYDNLEQIGVGGMAAVYKARKVSIDKTVAIKVLFPYLATDASFIERFQREAKAAASIQHENIVNVIDYGESEGAFFIVMEYYQGSTLEDLMKSRPGIPLDIAVQIVLEVAYGLEAAHALDIVHRDIKPSNVIFTNQGGIKIADFGLAKKSDSMTMITQQGKVIGTPAYMSPEQAAGRPVGPASDIFSLGVVAYELFGRCKPFEGKSYSDVLEKIQTYEPPSVTTSNPLIEPDFARIVGRMLEKSDRDRYLNASMLIDDIESAMEKAKIARDRRRMLSYVRDPNAYDAAFTERTLTGCLSRGTFFLQKGQSHLDEAALEFRRILFLDPENERARKNLERIKSQRGGAGRTQVIATARTAAGSHPTTRPVPARGPEASPRRSRRAVPRWVLGTGVAAVAAAIVVGAWWSQRSPVKVAPPRDAAPSTASLLDSPAHQRDAAASVRPDGLDPVVLDSVKVERASVDPGTGGSAKPTRATQTGGDSDSARLSKRETEALGREGKSAEPTTVAASNQPSTPKRTPSENDAKRPDTTASGTKAATKEVASSKGKGGSEPPASRPAVAKPADGTLSVFFLGGVGEFFVNGKRFEYQPPFEGVSLPAGTYRVACRMSGDTAPKEITVSIVSNKETVIEYEVGQLPVATTE